MKKGLLLGLAVATAQLSFGQLTVDGKGYNYDNTSASSNCFLNSAPNNGGIRTIGATFTATATTTQLESASGPLILTSVADVTVGDESATWFGLPFIDLDNDACTRLFSVNEGVDLSTPGNGIIEVVAESNTAGAVLEIFLGGPGENFPSSSTFNTGNGASIIASYTFANADEEVTYTINLEEIDETVWADWADKDSIQSIGFRSQTNDAVFEISQVKIGSSVVGLFEKVRNTNFKSYPNPANGLLNVELANNEKVVSYEVMDLTSQVIVSENLSTSSNIATLNTSTIEEGVYVIKINTASGNILSKKIVIKH